MAYCCNVRLVHMQQPNSRALSEADSPHSHTDTRRVFIPVIKMRGKGYGKLESA